MAATQPTPDQLKAQARAVLGMITALGDAVRDAGAEGLPEGPVYTAYMTRGVSLESFGKMVNLLVNAGAVRRSGHVLYWCGPPADPQPKGN